MLKFLPILIGFFDGSAVDVSGLLILSLQREGVLRKYRNEEILYQRSFRGNAQPEF
jgi:hypothetical protein